jgi:integrase
MPAIRYARFRAEVEELYQDPDIARKTYLQMRQILGEFEAIGIMKTSQMDELAIVRWKKAHPDRGSWRVRSLLLTWRAACNIAARKGYLRVSPFTVRKMDHWIKPAEPQCVGHHPLASIGLVMRHLRDRSAGSWEDHRLYALAATVAWTGVRAGEAQHAMVADFRLFDGVLMIDPRRRRKTRASAQPVPIAPALDAIVRPWLPLAGSVHAFPGTRRRTPWTGGSPGSKPLDRLKAAGLAVGVEGFTFQSLRHSWATHAEGPWDMTDPQIQRNLRHTTIRTSRHYRHADLPNLRVIGSKVAIPMGV